MASLEDTIHSAVPGGSVGKPLMLALLALLASGALFRGGGAGATTSAGPEPTSKEGAGGVLGGRIVGQITKGRIGECDQFLGWLRPKSAGLARTTRPSAWSDLIKALAQRSGLSEEELTKQLSQVLPGVADKLTPAGRLPTLAELSK
jgi:uncharacterized protein YidB (DUF937 family)